jgi:hypothetical protein
VIAVRMGGSRITFEDAHSYDYVRWTLTNGEPADSLTIFNANGDRIATFYKWDSVDAGETP